MKKQNGSPEAQAALQKIETRNFEPWEVDRLLKTICASGEFGLIRRAILFLEADGYNPLKR